MKRLLLPIALSLTCLQACSDGGSAQGPGSETSGLSARVLDSTGRPLAGAGVRLVALEDAWRLALGTTSRAVLARGVTDKQGLVRFAMRGTDQVAVELEDTLLAARVVAPLGTDSVRELRAVRSSRMRVAARVPGETISGLRLAGTGYVANPLPDGSWSFPGLPRGTYSVVAATDLGLALLGRVSLDRALLDTALVADSGSVLVEDFGNPLARNRFGELLGGGWWYAVTDAQQGGSSSTTPSEPRQGLVRCPVGICLSMGFKLDTVRLSRYALAGLDLGGSRSGADSLAHLADFTRVNRVRFWASGSGDMLFQLAVHTTDGSFSPCYTRIVLPDTLAPLDVKVADLTCDSVNANLAQVYGMTWTATSDAHLTLGRVSLMGGGPRDVFRELRAP